MKPPVKNIKNDIIKATTLIYIVYNNTLNKPIPRTKSIRIKTPKQLIDLKHPQSPLPLLFCLIILKSATALIR